MLYKKFFVVVFFFYMNEPPFFVVYSIYSTENPNFSYSLVPQYKINVTCTDEYSLTSWGEFTVNIKPNKPPELDKLPGTRRTLNHFFSHVLKH